MDNPCFDKKTRTSCPERCCGCASTCEKWAEYTEHRNKRYDRNREGLDRLTDHYEIERDIKIKKKMERHW
jgi:hypothetical protein